MEQGLYSRTLNPYFFRRARQWRCMSIIIGVSLLAAYSPAFWNWETRRHSLIISTEYFYRSNCIKSTQTGKSEANFAFGRGNYYCTLKRMDVDHVSKSKENTNGLGEKTTPPQIPTSKIPLRYLQIKHHLRYQRIKIPAPIPTKTDTPRDLQRACSQ